MRAVSSWSLHRTLGRFVAPESSAAGGPLFPSAASPGVTLLDLPAELKARGYDTLQLCHFHLPDRSPEYLSQFRSALAASEITLDALLIDDGDLTVPEGDEVEAWIGEWVETGIALGAHRARIIAGKAAPTRETIAVSARRMRRIAEAHPQIRIMTENWWALLPDADAVEAVLAETGDSVGLLIDLGNWSGPDKYEQLARIAPIAEDCHAKCHFTEDGPDRDDYLRCLHILKDAGFGGPLALIYDGPSDDEWSALDLEHALVREVFTS